MTADRLADLRSTLTSMADADAAMQEITKLECQLAKAKAQAQAKINTVKSHLTESTRQPLADLNAHRAELTKFIVSHPDQFTKPRKRKTFWGSFGLRTVTSLHVDDEDRLIPWLRENGFGSCLHVTTKLDKEALTAELNAGTDIPGATLNRGDTAVCRPDNALIKQAKAEAAQ